MQEHKCMRGELRETTSCPTLSWGEESIYSIFQSVMNANIHTQIISFNSGIKKSVFYHLGCKTQVFWVTAESVVVHVVVVWVGLSDSTMQKFLFLNL